MLKFLLFALIGYFLFSRLFGRVIFIKTHQNFDRNRRPSDTSYHENSTTIHNIGEDIEKEVDNDEGEYIDFEEIK